jgi:hypothetical protein
MNISGSRIDLVAPNGYELTYFGVYQTGLASQSLFIRNRVDLVDIRDQINKIIEVEAYVDSAEVDKTSKKSKAERTVAMIKREQRDGHGLTQLSTTKTKGE